MVRAFSIALFSTNCIFLLSHNNLASLAHRVRISCTCTRCIGSCGLVSAVLTVRQGLQVAVRFFRGALHGGNLGFLGFGQVLILRQQGRALPVMIASGVFRSWARAAVCSARCCSNFH